MGTYRIYPNMFVVLVAGSGRCRKSTSIGQIEKLFPGMENKPNIIAQKITPEALIEAMRDKKDDEITAHQGFVVVDELSNFLNKRTYEQGLAALLISLYDCKESFEYRTKGRGKEELKHTCLGLLGGSTIEWIREAVPTDAIGGGLTSRILFIYVKNPPPPQAWTESNPENDGIRSELIIGLDKIASLQGQMELSPEAKEFYITQYNDFYDNSSFYENKYLSGYASRRHVHMIKLAILFSVAETDKMIIELRHIEQAYGLLLDAENHMVEVLSLITSTETGSKIELVRAFIRKRGECKVSDLQRHFSRQMNSRELGELTHTLISSGEIRFQVDGQRGYYQWIR